MFPNVSGWRNPAYTEAIPPKARAGNHYLPRILLSHIVNAVNWCVDCQGFSIIGVDKDGEDQLRPLSQFGSGIEDSLIARLQNEVEILLNIL